MKEWKKPFVKCVLLEEADIVTNSIPVSGQAINIDDAGYVDTTTPSEDDSDPIFGRTH